MSSYTLHSTLYTLHSGLLFLSRCTYQFSISDALYFLLKFQAHCNYQLLISDILHLPLKFSVHLDENLYFDLENYDFTLKILRDKIAILHTEKIIF